MAKPCCTKKRSMTFVYCTFLRVPIIRVTIFWGIYYCTKSNKFKSKLGRLTSSLISIDVVLNFNSEIIWGVINFRCTGRLCVMRFYWGSLKINSNPSNIYLLQTGSKNT